MGEVVPEHVIIPPLMSSSRSDSVCVGRGVHTPQSDPDLCVRNVINKTSGAYMSVSGHFVTAMAWRPCLITEASVIGRLDFLTLKLELR